MTAVQARAAAAAVPLGTLSTLEPGTVVAWDGLVAATGVMFSPLEHETAPDVVALVDGNHVDVVRFAEDSQHEIGAFPAAGQSVAGLLERVAALRPALPVLRFAVGVELSNDGLRDVPAVALWTGPVLPAWQVPLTSLRPDLRGYRISWQGAHSHRTTALDPMAWAGPDPTSLTAEQKRDGTWTLRRVDAAVAELDQPSEHASLEQILTWMTAHLHTLLERHPFQHLTVRPFVVIDPDGSGPLTVRMW